MYKQLTKISLVDSFGKGSRHPLRKVVCSLGLATIFAIVTGLWLAHNLSNVVLARDLPRQLVFAIFLAAIFTIISFLLLPIIYMIGDQQSALGRILSVLPLSKKATWYVTLLPVISIGFIITLFATPVLWILSRSLGSSPLILLIAYFFALGSSISFCTTVFAKHLVTKYIVFVAICSCQFYLLDAAVGSDIKINLNVVVISILLMHIACWSYVGFCYITGKISKESDRRTTIKIRIPKQIIKHSWFGFKIFRNSKTKASFVFCLVISGSIAVLNYVKHQTNITPDMLMVLAGVLVCSIASDIRTTVKRHKSAEIFSLLGTKYFVNSEIKNLSIVGAIAVAPLLPQLISLNRYDLPGILAHAATFLLAASLIGLTYGTILIPDSGEIGVQFFTSIVSIATLLLLPKLFKLSSLSLAMQSVSWLCVAGICFLLITTVEEIRKKGYGYVK